MSKFANEVNELVKFRLLHMPCCGQLLCWINPRLPNYCPECGKIIYPDVKGHILKEQELWLKSKLSKEPK